MDQVKELQIKLGYAKETVRLYYPLSSLEMLVGTSADLIGELNDEISLQNCGLGQVKFTLHKSRVEVNIPPEGTEYVHQHVEASAFLVDLIDLFQKHHHCEMEDVRAVFARHGNYVSEKMPEGTDFDYVMYFEDQTVDEYYYCIKMEMGHTIYHRFMREDYEALL